ncbi:hypothetical protein LPJ57_008615, partial [Coemansia sp. RSA 486]
MRRVLDAIVVGVVALGIAHASPDTAGPQVERSPLPPGHITNLACAQDGHRACIKDRQQSIMVCNNGKYVAAHCPHTMACQSDGTTAHCVTDQNEQQTAQPANINGPQGNKRSTKYVVEAIPDADKSGVVAVLGHKIVVRHHHKPKLVLHYDGTLPRITKPEPEPEPETYHADGYRGDSYHGDSYHGDSYHGDPPPPVYYDGVQPESGDYSGGGHKPVV